MSEYKIEKGVPIPTPRRRGAIARFPLREMVEGDSFFVDTRGSKPENAKVSSTVSYFAKRNGGKFMCRQQDTGIRVWCLERIPSAVTSNENPIGEEMTCD